MSKNLNNIYKDIADKIIKQKLQRASWLQKLIIKRIIKDDEDTKL